MPGITAGGIKKKLNKSYFHVEIKTSLEATYETNVEEECTTSLDYFNEIMKWLPETITGKLTKDKFSYASELEITDPSGKLHHSEEIQIDFELWSERVETLIKGGYDLRDALNTASKEIARVLCIHCLDVINQMKKALQFLDIKWLAKNE
jgi:hypothetical protein